MGLSIHYQGKLKNAALLPALIEEVIDIANVNQWKYFVFENEFPNTAFSLKPNQHNLYGICVSPPECEMVSISFLSNGKMCSVEKLQINKYSEDIEADGNLYYLHTKTQAAGIEIHKKIILLFDYLNTAYFENFELYDEGQFWETRDEELLKSTFGRYTDLLDNFESYLKKIPLEQEDDIENYIFRTAENLQATNSTEEDLPQLDIYQENEFKKLKLSIEYGATFPDNTDTNIPPEIEGHFLDYVEKFENALHNTKPITIFKKLGQPKFKNAAILNDTEITIELERIQLLMKDMAINLDVLASYSNQERLIYTFITEELFLHEINDMNLPGMITCFIYEDFHPNHEYDLKRDTEDFLQVFFNKKDDFYKKNHSQKATNHIFLNNFRSLFKKFKMKFFEFDQITFDAEDAVVRFNIGFWAKIKHTDIKIFYSGVGNITFKQQNEYWHLKEVTLPILN